MKVTDDQPGVVSKMAEVVYMFRMGPTSLHQNHGPGLRGRPSAVHFNADL